MNAPCLRDVAAHLSVPPAHLVDELRTRFALVLDAATRVDHLAGSQAVQVHADLDAVAEFIAAVRLDLPVPYLPATAPVVASTTPEIRSLERSSF